jgi:hypothetical protein
LAGCWLESVTVGAPGVGSAALDRRLGPPRVGSAMLRAG